MDEVIRNTHTKDKGLMAYLLFLLWPFASILYVLRKRVAISHVKNIIWVFCGFFGFTFIISDPTMDANRYKELLEHFYDTNYVPFWPRFFNFYDQGIYSATDFYGNLITMAFAQISNNFKVFFALIGLIYGYFYSRNICYIFEKFNLKPNTLYTILLLMTLVLLIPFWNINGYRFYTGAHVFIFGALRIVFEKKYRYLLLCAISILFHFSMVFPMGVILIYCLFGNRYWIYCFGLLISLFFANVNTETIYQNAQYAPVFVQNKVSGYTRDTYVRKVDNLYGGTSWYVLWHTNAMLFLVYISTIVILVKRRSHLNNTYAISILSFAILIVAASNFVSSIPSMGRFINFSAFFAFSAFLLIFLNRRNSEGRFLKYLALPLISLFAIVEIRIGFDFIGLNTLFLNPMTAPFFEDSPALINFFKW